MYGGGYGRDSLVNEEQGPGSREKVAILHSAGRGGAGGVGATWIPLSFSSCVYVPRPYARIWSAHPSFL